MDDPIEFEGQLTLPMVRRALLLAGKPGPILRWTFTALAAPFVLMSFVVLFRDPDPTFLMAPVILTSLGLLIWFSPTFAARSTLQKNSQHIPLAGSVTDDAVELREQYSTSKFPFSIYQRFKASKSIVVLIHQNGGLNLFPREFFGSDGDFEKFKSLVAQRVPPSHDIRRFLIPLAIWFLILVALIAYSFLGR